MTLTLVCDGYSSSAASESDLVAAGNILSKLRNILPDIFYKTKLDEHIELYATDVDALLALWDWQEESPCILGQSWELQSDIMTFYNDRKDTPINRKLS